MKPLSWLEALAHGLDVFLKNWDDTKLISYLATNSCAGIELSLKAQAQEFAGNYAVEEIKDIRALEPDRLLEYNLVDNCSTWFVYEKHWDTSVSDQQVEIYCSLFQPAIKDVICPSSDNCAAISKRYVSWPQTPTIALTKGSLIGSRARTDRPGREKSPWGGSNHQGRNRDFLLPMIKSTPSFDPAAINSPQFHTATPEPTLSASGKTMLLKLPPGQQGPHPSQSGENKLAKSAEVIAAVYLVLSE